MSCGLVGCGLCPKGTTDLRAVSAIPKCGRLGFANEADQIVNDVNLAQKSKFNFQFSVLFLHGILKRIRC